MTATLERRRDATRKLDRRRVIEECTELLGDSLAATVLVDKYLLHDEDGELLEDGPATMWDRMAKAVARTDGGRKAYRRYRELLEDFKFVPAGRIMYGLDNPAAVTLKNCYVIEIEDDSVEAIFTCLNRMAQTYKAGGGCGVDLSVLRPSGDPVHNAARTSGGPVAFMDLFSTVTCTIGQSARIGALLLSLDVAHPDVEKFVEIKGDGLDRIRYANVSVKVTDEFMRAVLDDAPFDLRWGGRTYSTVSARDLWNKIVHFAWKRAEPGLLFWDATCREVPAQQYDRFKCLTTNPCLAGDMRILTERGYRRARELWAEQGFKEHCEESVREQAQRIVSRTGLTGSSCVYRTSEAAPVYRVTYDDGSFIVATAGHRFPVKGKGRISLRDVVPGDMVPVQRNTSFGDFDYEEYALLAGWTIGDGSVSRFERGHRAHVRAWGRDIEAAMPALKNAMKKVYERSNSSTDQCPEYEPRIVRDKGFDCAKAEICSIVLGRLMAEDGLVPGSKHLIPASMWTGNERTIAMFMRGLFSADGSVQINESRCSASIRLAQSRLGLLSDCQLMLSQLGIDSTVTMRRKPGMKEMNDGDGGRKTYPFRAQYELIVSRRENLVRFHETIGFMQEWRNVILAAWLDAHCGSGNSARRTHKKVVSIEYAGEEETFCLTEPEHHEMTVSGLRVGNCGEVALSHGDSCNLGSMNLGKYVRSPFREDCSFDHGAFEKDVRSAVRFLDGVITLEKAPMEFQQWANDNGRRLGLGAMGFADMLLKMRTGYDTDDAVRISEKVFETFMTASYDESCRLAVEKGPFPAFDADRHCRSEFVKRLPFEIQCDIRRTGIRNIALHAIAPTGSISCLAGCSSSTEPVFMMKYVRKTNLGTAKEVVEHDVFHPVAKEYLEEHGQDLPHYFVSAHEVSPEFRIRMQGAIQRYIDQSISNTVNLPSTATEEEVGRYYVEAWRAGCKGITVYRDGSREGVLVSKRTTKDTIEVRSAPRRPVRLDARVHVIKPNGQKYAVFVGLLDDRVYEVFALEHEKACVSGGMEGTIFKESTDKGNTYSFESGAMLIRQLNRYEETDASLVTRLMSTALRHGTPLEFVVDQILKSKVPITNFARACARVLSEYVRAEETIGKFKCPSCSQRNVKVEGLCMTCMDCGWSKCG